jgi:hypothetical protein
MPAKYENNFGVASRLFTMAKTEIIYPKNVGA